MSSRSTSNPALSSPAIGEVCIKDCLGSGLSVDYWQIDGKSKPFQSNSVPKDIKRVEEFDETGCSAHNTLTCISTSQQKASKGHENCSAKVRAVLNNSINKNILIGSRRSRAIKKQTSPRYLRDVEMAPEACLDSVVPTG